MVTGSTVTGSMVTGGMVTGGMVTGGMVERLVERRPWRTAALTSRRTWQEVRPVALVNSGPVAFVNGGLVNGGPGERRP